MLVLTRKKGESIRIGDNVEIIVRRISGNRVAIAIEAPNNVAILRGELQDFGTDAEVDAVTVSESANEETAELVSEEEIAGEVPSPQGPYFVIEERFSPKSGIDSILPKVNEIF